MTTIEQIQATPDDVLRTLGLTERELFEVYVLGRRAAERARLAGRVDLIAGPGQSAEELTQPGDLLVRGAFGEGIASLSLLVDGDLHDLRAAGRAGLEPEGWLPGRYAWVVEGGLVPRSRAERFARRVTDARGYLPRDQALLRLAPDALVSATPAPPPVAVEGLGDLVDGVALDGEIDRDTREYVEWSQAELNRIDGAGLLVDGIRGPLTEAAVERLQERAGLTADAVLGPITEHTLLLAGAAAPPGVAPEAVTLLPEVGPSLGSLEKRYFPPSGKDAAVFSRKSTVEAIVDGREYFRQLKTHIDSLKKGDAWFITSWLHEPGFTFAGGSKLGDLLLSKVIAGVDVRVIIWANKQVLDNPKLPVFPAWVLAVVTNNVKAAEDLRARKDPTGGTPLNGRVLLDWSGNAASSHHMKLSVFSIKGKVTAFPSGIDYAQDRLDAPMHKPPGSGWHDAGNRVTGDAADAVLKTFVTRWTEASTLTAQTYDIGAGKKPYNPPTLTPFTPPRGAPDPASSDTSVQVVRSFPDSKEFRLIKNRKWDTLPADGVHEAKRTFQQMLGAAADYIYIEDQGFDAIDSLFPSLVSACKRGVKVIALVPGKADPTEGGGTKPPLLSSAVVDGILKKLSKAEQMNLAVWSLDTIFVHSKLVLIDDQLMSIGSANFMDRSMEFTMKGDDSECTVVSVTTGRAVADLRVKLWAEHMRVSGAGPEAELRDLSKSLGFWRPSWGSGITFPIPDSKLVFVGPPTGGVGSGGGGGSSGSSGGSRREAP